MKEKTKPHRRRRGQVIELDDTTFRIRIPLKRTKGGTRQYHNETLYNSTRAKAEKRVIEVLSQVDSRTYFAPTNKTFKEIASDWIKQKGRDSLRATTLGTYEDYLALYVYPSIGDLPVSEILPLDIRDLYNSLQDKGLSKNTIRQAQKVTEMIFHQAVIWKIIKDNPTTGISPPKQIENKGRESKAFNEDEAKLIVEVGMQDLKYTMFAFALLTGMRPAEYLGLKWQHVKLEPALDEETGNYTERGLIEVRENAVFVPRKGWTFEKPKTEKGIRNLYVPSALYYRLMDWKQFVDRMRRVAGKDWKEHNLVFPSRMGHPQNKCTCLKKLRVMLKQLGIDETHTLYSFRYSFATLSFLVGERDKVISDRMGHTKVDFTKEVYVKSLPQVARSTSDKFERLFFPACTTLAQSDEEPIM